MDWWWEMLQGNLENWLEIKDATADFKILPHFTLKMLKKRGGKQNLLV